jgi:acetyltransferase
VGTFRLDALFRPRSIAIAGASDKAASVGGIVVRKLLEGGFKGTIAPVNPKYGAVCGLKCTPTLAQTGSAPDLVVIATPAPTVPGLVTEAAALGCKAAIILSAGLGHGPGSLGDAALANAGATGLRLVGPNCLGVLSPFAEMNASFARQLPRNGPLALISQSGAIAAAMAEWAEERRAGFSGIISLGEAIDVDLADCLDYFAEDTSTWAILLYIEAVTDARKFMSAARRAARVKPVIVLKAGRHAEGAKAAATHTGAMAGSDAVYDAAFMRAGCIRVMDLGELFQAAELFAKPITFAGVRIAILTNGGGLGVLAVDRLMDLGGCLADLSPATLKRLDAVLPPTWSRANPVDIIGDATPERYAAATAALLEGSDCDVILVMNCPTGISSSDDAARSVIEAVKSMSRERGGSIRVFACWLGMRAALEERFRDAGIIPFETEADAVEGIMRLLRHRQLQARLCEAIPALAAAIVPDRAAAARVVKAASADNRAWLSAAEVSALLTAYGIACTPVAEVNDPEAAAKAADTLLAAGGACVVKLLSRDITHKSDVDGVRLNLASAEAVRSAAADIIDRAKTLRPEARIDGVTVQPMIVRPKARELIAGVAVDPTFGPVILFGHGGTAVEVINDKALSLLPLNIAEARALIARTRVSRILKGYRNVPAADAEAVAHTLVRLSRMVEDIPEIVGLDLNPLLADDTGVMALDARIEIDPAANSLTAKALRTRFAVRPYPRELEVPARLANGLELLIRPLRPDDEAALADMLKHVTPEDIRMRFFNPRTAMGRDLIARLTQLDYAREMALVATDTTRNEILGIVRLMGDANGESGEFAILIRSDHQSAGLGTVLMKRLISFAVSEGYRQMSGTVLGENMKMIDLCRELGFTIKTSNTPGVVSAELLLPARRDDDAAQ